MTNTSIDESTIKEAATLFGTPLLCYEHSELEKYSLSLRDALPTQSTLVYSVKAGPNSYIIKYLCEQNILFETASEGELAYLLSLGISPLKIIVSGQGKTQEYFQLAISSGVTKYNLESINELHILKKMNLKLKINCSIRINPDFSNHRSVLKMGGIASPFGIDEREVYKLLKGDDKHWINGIFMYAGSQYFNSEDIIYNTRYLFELCIDIYKAVGKKFEYIDFGGGFGVPEDDSDGELNLLELKKNMYNLFQDYISEKAFENVKKYFFESGRYISARTAVLITKVLDIKESKGEKFVITDMGINSLGVKQYEYRIYSPVVKEMVKREPMEYYTIVGRTCTPIDQTHPKVRLHRVCIGDLLYISDCGAYSVSFSPNNFCGLRRVSEIVHRNNKFIITNRQESCEEVYGRTLIENDFNSR